MIETIVIMVFNMVVASIPALAAGWMAYTTLYLFGGFLMVLSRMLFKTHEWEPVLIMIRDYLVALVISGVFLWMMGSPDWLFVALARWLLLVSTVFLVVNVFQWLDEKYNLLGNRETNTHV